MAVGEEGDDGGDLVLVEQRVEVLHPVHVERAVKHQQALAITWAGGKLPVYTFVRSVDEKVKPKAARNQTILPPSV